MSNHKISSQQYISISIFRSFEHFIRILLCSGGFCYIPTHINTIKIPTHWILPETHSLKSFTKDTWRHFVMPILCAHICLHCTHHKQHLHSKMSNKTDLFLPLHWTHKWEQSGKIINTQWIYFPRNGFHTKQTLGERPRNKHPISPPSFPSPSLPHSNTGRANGANFQ